MSTNTLTTSQVTTLNNKASENDNVKMFLRYSSDPWEFVAHQIKTYDAEKGNFRYFAYFSGTEALPTFRNNIKELIYTLDKLRREKRMGEYHDLLIEKSRQMYCTTAILAYLLWCLLFVDNFAGLVTSEKSVKIDKKSDPNSLLGRIDMMITQLPQWMHPEPSDLVRSHLTIGLKSRNSMISGDAGVNPGRAGQFDIIFNDEFAFQEFSETKLASEYAAAKGPIVFASTPNGKNNAFYRLRQTAGQKKIKLLTWHWSLRRTQAWYDKKKEEYLDAATLAQEQDISYTGSKSNRAFPQFISAVNTADIAASLPTGEDYIFLDFGWTHPTVLLFVRKTKEHLYIYDCHAGSEMSPKQHAEQAIKIMAKYNLKPNNYKWFGDPSGASKSRETGQSSYQLFTQEILNLTKIPITIQQANNKVIEGIQQVNTAFKNKAATIDTKATMVIDALNEAVFTVNAKGEITSDKYKDDWTADYCDVVRYAISTLSEVVAPRPPARKISSSLSAFTGV